MTAEEFSNQLALKSDTYSFILNLPNGNQNQTQVVPQSEIIRRQQRNQLFIAAGILFALILFLVSQKKR